MKRQNVTTLVAAALVSLIMAASINVAAQDDQDSDDSADRIFAEAHGWIYDDLAAGFARARETSRPLMVVIRCPP